MLGHSKLRMAHKPYAFIFCSAYIGYRGMYVYMRVICPNWAIGGPEPRLRRRKVSPEATLSKLALPWIAMPYHKVCIIKMYPDHARCHVKGNTGDHYYLARKIACAAWLFETRLNGSALSERDGELRSWDAYNFHLC